MVHTSYSSDNAERSAGARVIAPAGRIAAAALIGASALFFFCPSAAADPQADRSSPPRVQEPRKAAPAPPRIPSPRPTPVISVKAPPPPPPAGRTQPPITPPPSPPQPFPIEADAPPRRDQKRALAGFQGGVFLRDAADDIRIYLRGRLHLDFHSFFGAGARELGGEDGGVLLSPRFFARRARIELGGELFRRWFFLFGLDFGGQTITNPTGADGLSATPVGQPPFVASDRYAPIQSVGATALLANAYIDYAVLPQLHFTLGQHQAPFSLENRTSNEATSWMERSLPIRGFVQPNAKEMGLYLWGDLNAVKNLSYELGVFLGDGPNRPQVDAYPDWIGRIFSRPLAKGGEGALEKLQVGVSAHYGSRDPKYVAYDYPAITTAQGWTLWDPRYRDSRDRLVHVIPSGAQRRIGGELRLPIDRYELRSEAYYVVNGTREAHDGFESSTTERLGRVKGVGWYVQLSAWPLGDAFVTGDPGFSRPPRLDLTRDPPPDKRGLEVLAIVGGVNADYDGAIRGGSYDPRTPGAPGGPATAITAYQLGLGANYWYSRYLRATVNYTAYVTPGSGAGGNLALVPGNLLAGAGSTSTWMHELGARLAAAF
ncbi:OprO/OprP family phosphate-selective porin [Polyangium aurulentum]|nr:OprO/OprP family phosphate-selective porin [Polyangium aurulentum]